MSTTAKQPVIFHTITFAQSNILLALAKYKFLTASQMTALGIMSKTKNINEALRELRWKKQPLVAYQSFGTIPKVGKLENIHYLTRYGKQALMNHLGLLPSEIKTPIGTSTLFYQDYFHRKNTIDCEIAMNLWAESRPYLEAPFCTRYFDTEGNNRRSKNLRSKNKFALKGKARFLIPDMVFQIRDNRSKQESLFVLEMYNGHNAMRTTEQLKKHVEAIELGSISDAFGVNYSHQVLVVCEHQVLQEAVIGRIKENSIFTNVKDYFLFKTFTEVKSQPTRFGENWLNLKGEMVSLFVKENELQAPPRSPSLESF